MAFNHTISAVLRSHWAIDRQWAEAHLPLVASMLQGNPVSFVERTGNEAVERPFAIDPVTMQRHEFMVYDFRTDKMVLNANIPLNSVGIIPISGPITKYNGECGEPGSIARNNWLMDMKRRDNIGSVVMLMDTPGGQVGAQNASMSIIKGMGKPVLSYVDGMSASLGMWYTSVSDEVYLSDEEDQMGSVGSYATILDFQGYYEQMGLKLHKIYAPQSTEKNEEYRAAIDGNYEPMQEMLRQHTDRFIQFVKTNRTAAVATEEKWNKGKLFFAKDAVRLGLADGIKPFDQVISKAAWLAKRKR